MAIRDETGCLGAIGLIILVMSFVFFYPHSDDPWKWPEELEKIKHAPCDLYNYRSCKEGSWFGIESPTLKSTHIANGNFGNNTKLLRNICLHIGEPPDESTFRVIINPSNMILLCKIRAPEDIDRGSVLAEMERLGYQLP
jgi:hypothetical protein